MRKQLRKAALMGTLLTMVFVLLFVVAVLRQDVEVDRGNLLAILNTARNWTGEASSNMHDLAKRIAASATAEAVVEPARRRDGERGGLLVVERAQALEGAAARVAEGHVAAHHIVDAAAVAALTASLATHTLVPSPESLLHADYQKWNAALALADW